jgi:hypothetical protein
VGGENEGARPKAGEGCMSNNPSNLYRFRAECQFDVDQLRQLLGLQVERITMTQEPPFPDVEVELQTQLSLDAVKTIMLQVIDGQVMVETVANREDYTAERNYKATLGL